MSYFLAITTYQLPNHMVTQVIRALQIYKNKHITIKIIDTTSTVAIILLILLFFRKITGMKLNISVNTDNPNKISIKYILILLSSKVNIIFLTFTWLSLYH